MLNLETGQVWYQYHVIFYYKFVPVPFMRECTITQKWEDLAKKGFQEHRPENIELKYPWFTTDTKED